MQHSLRWLIAVFSAFVLLLAVGGGLYALWRTLQPEPPPAGTAGTVDWAAMLTGLPDEGFDRPSGTWQLELPGDHGAHPNTRAETWTISAHVRDDRGDHIGIQFALLRVGLASPDAPRSKSRWAPRALYRGHVTLLLGTEEPVAGEEQFHRECLASQGTMRPAGKSGSTTGPSIWAR